MESAGRERGRGRQRKNTEQESRQKRNQDRHKATKMKNQKCVMQDRDGPRAEHVQLRWPLTANVTEGEGGRAIKLPGSETTRQTGSRHTCKRPGSLRLGCLCFLWGSINYPFWLLLIQVKALIHSNSKSSSCFRRPCSILPAAFSKSFNEQLN